MVIEMLDLRKHESQEAIHSRENFLDLGLIDLYLNHDQILVGVTLMETLIMITISKVILLENGIEIVLPKTIKG